MKVSKKSLVAGVAMGASVVAATTLGAGTASAEARQVDMSCVGLSPNIVDLPYSVQVIVNPDATGDTYGPTTFTVHAGASLWGYGTHPTLNWTNLATGASGSVTGHGQVSSIFGSGSTFYFSHIPTGTGPLRVDLSVTNTGFYPIPAINCSGNVLRD